MENLFTEQERRVFSYFNGAADVFSDPVRIYRRLLQAFGGDLDIVLEHTRHPAVEVWGPAVERMTDAIRVVFDMVPFDPATGLGATESDCLAALKAWRGWMAAKKASAAG